MDKFGHCSSPPVREQCRPTPTPTPTATVSRLLRLGAVALVVAAVVVMLCASTAALYRQNASDKNVYNVRYRVNLDGEVREASVEIDSDNSPARFKTGSGTEEASQIHDFQTGITGIRFSGGDKCYVKSQRRAGLPHAGAQSEESLMLDLTRDNRDILPVRFDEDLLTWVAADRPMKDTDFLSEEILDLCGELPIHWLQPSHPKDGERRKRDVPQSDRQFNAEGAEAAADERDPANHAAEEDGGAQSSAGSAYNPDNPYHRGEGAGEEGAATTFDAMLDRQGICCSECHRGYTHCQRICSPLRGYWPWPYDYRGCQVACRVIMPCRWWVARIFGVV